MAFVFNKSTPATGAEAMYNFKECLKTAGWTVLSSSDGTTYNASGDQITSGASGADGMANTRAWYRLQSPAGAGSQQIIIQRGTTNITWRMKRSRTAGFSGGSPAATQTPSATDETIMIGGGTDASPTFANFHSGDGIYRWNVGADDAAPYGFWAAGFPTGGGSPGATLCFDPLTGGEPTDADQQIIICAVFGQSGLLTNSLNAESGASTTNQTYSQIISTSPGSSYIQFPAVTFNTSGGGIYVPNIIPTNPISTKDEAFPLLYMRRSTLGINSGYKGISTLVRWTGTNRITGDTLTVSTTRDRIVYGHVSLPWDGSVPSV